MKRRRVSFDIDENLYTSLKILAAEKEMKIYELIEESISNMLRGRPKILIDDLIKSQKNIDQIETTKDETVYKNPIIKACEEHGFSFNQLALIANVQVESVRRITRGETKKISSKLLEVLYQLGYGQSVIDEYEQWKKTLVMR